MFSLVVTLFQKYRKLTEYIHNLGIAPPLFEICPRVGFCLKFTPDFFFLHPTVVSIHVTGLRLASPLKNASLALKILSKAVNIFVGNFKTLV